MLSVGERDASVVRTGPKSSAIITVPGEKCGLGEGSRMQLTREDIEALRKQFVLLRREGERYFAEAEPVQIHSDVPWRTEHTWVVDDEETLRRGETLVQDVKRLSVELAAAARGSPLLADADMQELRHSTRQMLANVRFSEYQHSGVHVHHDEGNVLGVDPPSHEEIPLCDADTAGRRFDQAAAKMLDVADLLLPTDAVRWSGAETSNYRPNTAFVMMAIDDSKPELEDIRNGIKEVFGEFGIAAITADEIEHEEAITDRILDEIDTSEFLIADLTHERPNVYYEIGHAHARSKRVILVRRKGTRLHFDVAHRKCPEYENATALKRLLRKRLESVTNKKHQAGGA